MLALQFHPDRATSIAQVFIQRRQWHLPALREFQITRIIDRQFEPFGKLERRCPGEGAGLGIHAYWKHRQLLDRPIPEIRVDALSPDRHLKTVGDLKPPKHRDDSARLRNPVKYGVCFRRTLVLEIPGQRQ